MQNKEQTRKYLNDFAKYVIQQSRSNLSKQGKSNTRALYNSLDSEIEVGANSFRLAFLSTDYAEFVDKGVKGKTSSAKAPNSPFKFGSGTGAKGGLTNGILKWVQQKGIQFKDKKSGRFLSYQNTSFLIARSIYNKGIKPSLFFTKPFEKAFERLPDELVIAYGLDVEEFLKYTINKK
jgi:hypothetical protein